MFSCTTCSSADRVLRQNLGAKGSNLDSFSGEESSKFFRDIHRKKAESPNKRLSWTSLRAMLVSALTQRRISSFQSKLTGKELPLNVWLAKGWPKETVEASPNFWSDKHKCQLYVVDVKESCWAEEFQRIESEVLQHESEAARARKSQKKKRKAAADQEENASSEGEMDLPQGTAGEQDKENKNPDKLRKKVQKQNVAVSNRAAKALGPFSSSWTSMSNLYEKVEKAGVSVPAGTADLFQKTSEKFRCWSEASRAAMNMHESSKHMAEEDVQPLPELPFTAAELKTVVQQSSENPCARCCQPKQQRPRQSHVLPQRQPQCLQMLRTPPSLARMERKLRRLQQTLERTRRRKLSSSDSLLDQFQSLRQIRTLTHVQCREVMTLLNHGEEKTGKRSAAKEHMLYPVASPAAREIALQVCDVSVSRHMFSLPAITQNKINACPFFRECFEAALQKHNNALELLLYWEEAVPGNVLAPDLRRKAAMTYVSYPDFPVLWTDTAWMTLAVTRSQDLQNIPDGLTRSVSIILDDIHNETKNGFMIEVSGKPVLVHLHRISILADEDGLRLITGSKGKNCEGKSRGASWMECKCDEMQRASQFQFAVCAVLFRMALFAKELGLWYTTMLSKSNVTHARLSAYAHNCWQSCGHNTFDMTKLFAQKLWVSERDYRGDATDTLQALPVCVAFSHEILLPIFPDLQEEIQSLTALYRVILCWLRAKYGNAAEEADRMEMEQKEHLRCFLAVYGPQLALLQAFQMDTIPNLEDHMIQLQVPEGMRGIPPFDLIHQMVLAWDGTLQHHQNILWLFSDPSFFDSFSNYATSVLHDTVDIHPGASGTVGHSDASSCVLCLRMIPLTTLTWRCSSLTRQMRDMDGPVQQSLIRSDAVMEAVQSLEQRLTTKRCSRTFPFLKFRPCGCRQIR
eukprot:s448_g6.t1